MYQMIISRILIVEDDPRTRKTIERFCQEIPETQKTQITGAANGLEALACLKEAKPDVMFLDMEMPGMDGRELLSHLMEYESHINVVVISGYDGFDYTKKAIQYGAVDYLLKPVNRKQVHDILVKISHSPDLASAEQAEEAGIAAIRAYLDHAYSETITLGILAERFHYSREYISREFKKQYGTGVVRYLNDLRLERARVLLRQGMTIQNICVKVGFSDESYFTKLFKEKYGMTPKKY